MNTNIRNASVMSLEDRVLKWMDLGEVPYSETFDIQTKLYNMKREGEVSEDFLLSVQHPTEINFGSNERDNLFSDRLTYQIGEVVGKNPEDVTDDEVEQALDEMNVRFSKTSRGGGATVLAPGQFVYHPIVDVDPIVEGGLTYDDMTGIGDYKNMIDEIMKEVLEDLGVEGLKTVKTGYNEVIERERRDVWLEEGSRAYKLGSKGVVVKQGISYNGFSLYVHEEGVESFDLIKPCGYSHSDLSVSSVEHETGERFEKETVDSLIEDKVREKFRYDTVDKVDITDTTYV